MTIKWKVFTALVLAFAMTPLIYSQAYLSGIGYATAGSPTNLATGDFNRDGNSDVVYQDSQTGGNIHIMLGNGNGTFTAGQVIPIAGAVGACITVGDINGDGIADLVLGYNGFNALTDKNSIANSVTILLSNGDGTFAAPIYSPAFSSTTLQMIYHIGIADFDGDGHPDIAYSDGLEFIFFLRGDGAGHFVPMPPQAGDHAVVGVHAISVDGPADVIPADFNSDGKPDIVIEGQYGMDIALNQGNASFPAVTNPDPFINDGFTQNAFKLSDMNGDGIPDIVLATTNNVLMIYDGHADGSFAKARTVGSGGLAIVALTDLNGDGRIDVVLNSANGIVTSLQAADGSFPSMNQSIFAPGDFGAYQALFADFDKDGKGDIITGGTNALVFIHGNIDGTFHAAPSYAAGSVEDVTPVDLNNDSNVDVFTVSQSSSFNFGVASIWAGSAAGSFGTGTSITINASGRSAAADFNGDGKPDIFNSGVVFYGDGNGSFQNSLTIALSEQNNEYSGGYVAVADFNSDGRPDGVTSYISNAVGGSSFLAIGISGGTTSFSTSVITLSERPGPMVAGDFNRDGHPDLAVVGTSQLFILTGAQSGELSLTATYPLGYIVRSSLTSTLTDIEAADLDGDGNLDLLIPIAGSSLLEVFYGSGDGTFEPLVKMPLSADTWNVTATDLNHDDIPDLIMTGTGLVRIVHGLGNRQFDSTENLFAGSVTTGKVRVVDLNHDGNPDLLIPNGGLNQFTHGGNTFTVLLNQDPPALPDVLARRIGCNPTPSRYMQAFTCVSKFNPVANTITPTGIITFSIDSNIVSEVVLASSSASFTVTSPLAIGSHQIQASFPGDATYKPVQASTTQLVYDPTTTAVLTGSPTPTSTGTLITLTATISPATAPGDGVPTGTVTFTSGGSVINVASLVAGVATYATNSLPLGINSVTCTYSGNSVYSQSNCNTVPINLTASSTATNLAVSPNPAYQGQTVMLSATVSGNSSVMPSGNVTFLDGNTVLGSAAMSATGNASIATSSLAIGAHYLTASYAGGQLLTGSVSTAVQENVLADSFTIDLVPGKLSVVRGQSGTVSIHLTSLGAFSGPVTLSNGALPGSTSAVINPPSINLSAGSTSSSTLTFSTGYSVGSAASSKPGSLQSADFLVVPALILIPFATKRADRLQKKKCVVLLLLLLQTLAGCNNITAPFAPVATGNYQLTIMATDSNHDSKTATLTVAVTP